jgi:Man1-Src1p-C-terminal domain
MAADNKSSSPLRRRKSSPSPSPPLLPGDGGAIKTPDDSPSLRRSGRARKPSLKLFKEQAVALHRIQERQSPVPRPPSISSSPVPWPPSVSSSPAASKSSSFSKSPKSASKSPLRRRSSRSSKVKNEPVAEPIQPRHVSRPQTMPVTSSERLAAASVGVAVTQSADTNDAALSFARPSGGKSSAPAKTNAAPWIMALLAITGGAMLLAIYGALVQGGVFGPAAGIAYCASAGRVDSPLPGDCVACPPGALCSNGAVEGCVVQTHIFDASLHACVPDPELKILARAVERSLEALVLGGDCSMSDREWALDVVLDGVRPASVRPAGNAAERVAHALQAHSADGRVQLARDSDGASSLLRLNGDIDQLPLRCVLRSVFRWLKTATIVGGGSALFVAAVVFVYRVRRRHREQRERDYQQMLAEAHAIMQRNKAESQQHPNRPAWVIIGHVHRELLNTRSIAYDQVPARFQQLWERVENACNGDASHVRSTPRLVGGEQHLSWEWIGPSPDAYSSPRQGKRNISLTSN